MRRLITVALAVLLGTISVITPILNVTVSANSAQPYWEGVSASGEVFVGEDCPLTVRHERLVLDLQEFPSLGYSSTEELLAYSGKVTAEYTFYNPADYTVKAKMVFPFGGYPSYGARDGSVSDTDKYDVMVNGAAVEKKLRHTWLQNGEFDIEEELLKFEDDYASHEFFAPDLSVYTYEYTVSDLTNEDSTGRTENNLCLTFNVDKTKSRLYFGNSYDIDEYGDTLKALTTNTKKNCFYVIGEPLSVMPTYEIFAYSLPPDVEKFDLGGEVSFERKEQLTFKEFLMKFCEEPPYGLLDVDWYNMVMRSVFWDLQSVYVRENVFSVGKLMRWYEYEMSVAPNATVVNAVTAPIYPAIDNLDGYNRRLAYDYTYLLSPAKTWADFGTLDIIVNTPYTMTKSNLDGFVKTDGGYTLSLDGLPNSELEFTLRDPENMKKDNEKVVNLNENEIALIIFFALLSVGLVAWIIVRNRTKNK